MITTDRIVWRQDGVHGVSIRDVRHVTADLRTLWLTDYRKDPSGELRLLCGNGEEYRLSFEGGAPLMGVWNSLEYLCARSRSEREHENE